MEIRYVSQYLALAQEGLVEEMLCPLDQGLLMANLDLEDNIFLYCLSCDYKNYIGMSLYSKIEKEIENRKRISK